MSNYKEQLAQQGAEFKALGELIPEAMRAFKKGHGVGVKANVLDAKTKELIALTIGITLRCEPCILAHMAALIKLGLTREELGDALSAILFMRGGPGMAYGAKALAIYDGLVAENA